MPIGMSSDDTESTTTRPTSWAKPVLDLKQKRIERKLKKKRKKEETEKLKAPSQINVKSHLLNVRWFPSRRQPPESLGR